MNANSLLYNKILQICICFLLCAGIGGSLLLPAADMVRLYPENPLTQAQAEEISVFEIGEHASDIPNIMMPTGDSASNKSSKSAGTADSDEDMTGEEAEDLQEQEESEPDEQDSDDDSDKEAAPEADGEQEPGDDETAMDDGSGDEGEDAGLQGEEGGRELELDLAAVMTWYKYETEPSTIVCAPSNMAVQTVNTAQLTDNTLKYAFSLTGEDAGYVDITEVSAAAGEDIFRLIDENGSVELDLPDGGNGYYTFRVNAFMEKVDAKGEVIEQELLFTFKLKFETSLDLEMELIWTPREGSEQKIVCSADKTESFSVKNTELTERVFGYSVQLTGSMADEAEIVSAQYSTASGQSDGELTYESGTLILDVAQGADTETYYLTFTVKIQGQEVSYQYKLNYRETMDVQMAFHWMEKGSVKRTSTCEIGGSVSVRVKNNQLSAGAIPYELELTGADGIDGRILSVSYMTDAGESGNLEASGSLPMRMAEGASSNTYHISASAMVNGQRLLFTFVIHYSADVSLQMEYSVLEDGVFVTRQIVCENTRSKTADAVYDDQLTDGMLDYTMTLTGSEESGITITSVSCYQTGSGRSIVRSEQGQIALLLKEGKTGENTFTIEAEDGSENTYRFTINIPYKHRGENSIKILAALNNTELSDGDEVINENDNLLTVKAWSEDSNGNVISNIPANGTDTKLIVELDGETITYKSSSGANSEYNLVPSNPEVGDTNEHTLYIYAEDAYGNYGELTFLLTGKRQEDGQIIGRASIYVDLTALGLGVVANLGYDVRANEPVSYVIYKAIMGEDPGEPYGPAKETLGWSGIHAGTLDLGFYLQSLTTSYTADALEDSGWPGSTEEEVLQAIDDRFGAGSGLAALWRCLYRNGLSKSSGSGGSFGEFDYTSGSGWMYSIGGTAYYPGQSMSDVYLRDGDVLTLRFTLAYGWDVSGGSAGYGSTVGYCVSALNGSITVNHRMEEVENEDGSVSSVCHCCGIRENCAHANKKWIDLEDGTHIQFCEDCRKELGDPLEHVWVYKEAAAEGENGQHICEECSAAEEHDWQELEGSNTATCTQPGIRSAQCRGCKYILEEEVAPKKHSTDAGWSANAEMHYEICSVPGCGETFSEGQHQYRYAPYVSGGEQGDDYECSICFASHEITCGGTLSVISQTCQKIVYVCDSCSYQMEKDGDFEEGHSYVGGSCEYCGEADPDATEPDDPETEPDDPETEPDDPETEPDDPETEPDDPETEPDDPETEPDDPGTEPEEPETEPDDPETEPDDPETEPDDPETQPDDPEFEPEEPESDMNPEEINEENEDESQTE